MSKINHDHVLEDIEELLELLDTAMEDDEKGLDFYESVKGQAEDMQEWITEREFATEKQWDAIRNWKERVESNLDNLS